jgi:hypothetical protein
MTVRDNLLQQTQDCNVHSVQQNQRSKVTRSRVNYRVITLWVSTGSCCWYELYAKVLRHSIYFNNIPAQFKWVLFVRAQHTQKINRMKFNKDMPTLGLEPNTCSLHSTLSPGLLVNTSNVWKYRRHFRSAVEHMSCIFGRVININSRSFPN